MDRRWNSQVCNVIRPLRRVLSIDSQTHISYKAARAKPKSTNPVHVKSGASTINQSPCPTSLHFTSHKSAQNWPNPGQKHTYILIYPNSSRHASSPEPTAQKNQTPQSDLDSNTRSTLLTFRACTACVARTHFGRAVLLAATSSLRFVFAEGVWDWVSAIAGGGAYEDSISVCLLVMD